ncbi:four helix bundle protein [Flavobacterium cyanobacteriorum]|uniref:Four helix bundle protein n=1 Tax=Flavobacterium cyanobacteriorum TaxID=2022802 RepID=A0A255Z9S2_9FLAO|nr:four helix bundle protein [Flavobacterium cyanobacteriorum]OYQ38313.1 four helix bundle protein [Flavobacterium cyanobacteriorum]
MKDYKNYTVWQKSHQLTLDVYKAVRNFPKEEMFSLTSQMKRSSSSIPTNIAEGCGRNTDKDFARFLVISFGSANELEYQIILSVDLDFINPAEGQILLLQIEEIKKMLNALISKINNTNAKS